MPFPKRAEAESALLEIGEHVQVLQGRAWGTLDTSSSAPITITLWQGKLLSLKWANAQLKFFRNILSFSSSPTMPRTGAISKGCTVMLNNKVYYLLVLIKYHYFFPRGRKFLTLKKLILSKWASKRYISYFDLISSAQKIPIHELLIWLSPIRYVSFVSYFKYLGSPICQKYSGCWMIKSCCYGN